MTPSPSDPFRSPAEFREAFAAGLFSLLQEEGLGALILVCANATFEAALWERLRDPLQRRFAQTAGRWRDALTGGGSLSTPEEDLLVFLKMALIGFDGFRLTEQRAAGPWRVQFNQLRALRPPRASGRRIDHLRADFDSHGFHFDKPFLKKEAFWAGDLAGRRVALLYNKFPFAGLHGLLIPEAERHLPQFLTERYHAWLWQVVAQLGEGIPGFGAAYNALGAYASVNHLHFQTFVEPAGLPLMDPRWRHNGGGEDYPLACHRFGEPARAWEFLESMHHHNQSYNLLYTPGAAYCLPRRKQGELELPKWTAGPAWSEMAGAIVTFNRDHYQGLTAEAIAAELAAWNLGE